MELLNKDRLRDLFIYGVNDEAVTGNTYIDELIVDIIDNEPTVTTMTTDDLRKMRKDIQRLTAPVGMVSSWDKYADVVDKAAVYQVIDKYIKMIERAGK